MIGGIRALLEAYQQRLGSWIRILLAVLWAALLWYLSSRPGGGSDPFWLSRIVWNGGHVVAFGVLSGLILLSSRGDMKVRFWFAVAVTLLYGLLDEYHQSQVPGRCMDPWDVCSDGLGAALFSCTIWWLLTAARQPRAWILPLAALSLISASLAA